jgi:hypothetical protein
MNQSTLMLSALPAWLISLNKLDKYTSHLDISWQDPGIGAMEMARRVPTNTKFTRE